MLFYVISDDIKAAKDKITTAGQGKYNIVFPGAKKHGIKAHAARKFSLFLIFIS